MTNTEVIHAQDQRCSTSDPRRSSGHTPGGAELKHQPQYRQKLAGAGSKSRAFTRGVDRRGVGAKTVSAAGLGPSVGQSPAGLRLDLPRAQSPQEVQSNSRVWASCA